MLRCCVVVALCCFAVSRAVLLRCADKCYGSCNNRRDKCDNDFKKCMNQQCAKQDSSREKEECNSQTTTDTRNYHRIA